MMSLLLAGAAVLPNDYALDQNWLCRPDRRDACAIGRDATEIAADGTMTVKPFVAAKAPAADCFYVYPTVSFDATGNSDMVANDEERKVIEAQFARFGSQCRTFAPLYRSVTLTALRAAMTGKPIPADRELNYADVRDAWNHYLKADNQGRPFVLIGHSQGAGLLRRLVAEEVDGKPVAGRMLSAMLLGTTVTVAKGKDMGGDFKATPLCRSASQSGCVITYASFRETAPPPANSRFAKTDKPGLDVACTNPAALGGGTGAFNGAYAAHGSWEMETRVAAWAAGKDAPKTPYVTLPGLLSGQCVNAGGASYLSVRVNADAKGARIDDVPGDVVVGTTILRDWGLHLIDVTLAYDDLAGLVATQLAGWQKRQGKP
jgi:hypothetical protein